MTEKKPHLYYKFDRHLLNKLKEEQKRSVDNADAEYTPSDANIDEVDDALQLIFGGYIEPNIFNSGDWVAEMNERMKAPDNTSTMLSHLLSESVKSGYMPEELHPEVETNYIPAQDCTESLYRLEKGWGELERYYKWDDCREMTNQIPNHLGTTPVETFVYHVFSGQYPSPEIMLAIAKAFKLYFRSEGRLTLEKVFFGKPKQGSGTRAKKFHRDNLFIVFHDTVQREKSSSKVWKEMGFNYQLAPLEKIAETFLLNLKLNEHEYEDTGGELDIDSFLRAYRRWKDRNPELSDK